MKSTLCGAAIFVAFFCILPDTFSQKGGSSPDTLKRILYLVEIASPQPAPGAQSASKGANVSQETYLVIFESNENGYYASPAKIAGMQLSFYKITCTSCSILRYKASGKDVANKSSKPVKPGSNKTLNIPPGAAVPVTDESLKKVILKALLVQTHAAGDFIQSELTGN